MGPNKNNNISIVWILQSKMDPLTLSFRMYKITTLEVDVEICTKKILASKQEKFDCRQNFMLL